MANTRFIRFFDKQGNDMNLASSHVELTSLYNGATSSYTTFSGKIFFPNVSVNLIESQQIFLLEEVTGPTGSFQLYKVPGSVTVVAGNPTVTGVSSDFTILEPGDTIEIQGTDYTVSAVSGATSMIVSPTPSSSTTLTSNIYYYNYASFNQLRTSPGTFSEKLVARFSEEQEDFFLYDIDFQEDIPFIARGYTSSFGMIDGSGDSVDPLTGRIQITDPVTLPTELNLGFSTLAEGIYERTMLLEIEKTYVQPLVSAPISATASVTFEIGGTSHEIFKTTEFFFQGVTGASSTVPFFEKKLEVTAAGGTSSTFLTANLIDLPDLTSNFSSYRILWKNTYSLAELGLYGEAEAEDERFRAVLGNFGKKIDPEYEYIFRESDINEDLPNFEILNKKRKELLLEGDNIYPYMGSYKGLINIINFFGYYDLRIKEYFLNVDENSSNFGKFLHVQVPKTESQRKELRAAWSIVPSSVYKKTSLFGLFYDLNRTTDEEDVYGIPEVVDSFDFTPEEVLIKLFGLKELLKREYLPLNARIYDITGEGIYFERVRIDTWADNLNHLVLDLGTRPTFALYPDGVGYIADMRRMDDFYIQKLSAQGLSGFYGPSASDPYLSAAGFTGAISQIFDTNVESYQYFLQQIYEPDGKLRPVVDNTWEWMPPGISNPDFNVLASRLFPLPDDEGVLAGSPVLMEALFEITWEDSYFTYAQLGILGPTGAPKNINLWTWDTLGRGEYIEMRWTIEKQGFNPFFYDSGRVSIDNFLVQTRGATVFSIPAQLSADISGGSVIDIDILNAGFGYTNIPSIIIAPPDTPGTDATASCTVENGYITGLTFSGGSGYTFPPTVTIEPPAPVYEIANRILHTVALPYEGEYQIGLYIYDITNGYTVDFKKFTVKNRNVDFAQSYRKETRERTWEDFSRPEEPTPEDRSYRTISWEEVAGPWYYPMHVNSQWEDAEISWESLNYSSYDGTSLYEYDFNSRIEVIDREKSLVVLSGDQTGFLSNLITLNVGDSLFFVRESDSLLQENLALEPDSVNARLYGDLSGTKTEALVDGVIGSTSIFTNIDTSLYLSPGDSLWVQNSWYTVNSVGSTSVEISSPLLATFSSSQALVYPLNGEISIDYSGSVEMDRYSRILITDNCEYSSLNPQDDFYDFFDGLTFSASSMLVKASESSGKDLILRNSSLSFNSRLFASWGLFSGTYAIEITNISLTGSNTQFRLKDPNRELYYIDGSFTISLADYDVDYAESRIGPTSLTYENSTEFTWNENLDLSWYGLEYHGGALCGYIIPFIAPGGNITVDENPTFVFSGDSSISSTKSGLMLASSELNSSLNPGISKYDYSVLPETELYIKDQFGVNVDFFNTFSPGATVINLTSAPDGGSLKIPAEISVGISGGSISNVTVLNPGYGYSNVPNVNLVSSPCSGGTGGSITLLLSGSPGSYYVSGATWSGGTGYSTAPAISVDLPQGYKAEDNWIWTGYEWVRVEKINGSSLELSQPLTFPVFGGEFPLLPYDYHKQLYLKPEMFQQFYYFIQGKAKNPSNENLSYVNFDNGVQSEWANHPSRTYTYPLRNSFLQLSLDSETNMSEDYLYNKWVYEGSDYPPTNLYPDYSSDVLSFDSRIPYSLTLQSAFSFIDSVVSSRQQFVKQFTPVVFHFDNCKMPGKKNPLWTIKDEETGKIEVVSNEKKFMWNFTKTGNYTVSLRLEDSNGNINSGEKQSFVVVNSD